MMVLLLLLFFLLCLLLIEHYHHLHVTYDAVVLQRELSAEILKNSFILSVCLFI